MSFREYADVAATKATVVAARVIRNEICNTKINISWDYIFFYEDVGVLFLKVVLNKTDVKAWLH